MDQHDVGLVPIAQVAHQLVKQYGRAGLKRTHIDQIIASMFTEEDQCHGDELSYFHFQGLKAAVDDVWGRGN